MTTTSQARWPLETWPMWKVVGASLVMHGGLAVLLVFSSLTPPLFVPDQIRLVSAVLVGFGLVCSIWSRANHSWWPRLGVGLVVWAFLLGIALRSWAAVASGSLLALATILTTVLAISAWALPTISYSISTRIWREQSAPRSRVGRAILHWGLGVGIGGAGVLGATIGMGMARSGGASIVYLFAGIGMTVVAFLMAQGYSHRMWEERPWA